MAEEKERDSAPPSEAKQVKTGNLLLPWNFIQEVARVSEEFGICNMATDIVNLCEIIFPEQAEN